jgi:hypothetical protein
MVVPTERAIPGPWGRALQHAAGVLREKGIKGLWFKLLEVTVYRRMVLLERSLAEPIADVVPGVPVVISLLRKTEMDEYAAFRPEANLSDIRHRLEIGHSCFVARHHGCIVHACWAATGRVWVDYLGCAIPLAPDEVYPYESFTALSFRGYNIAPMRITQSLRYFRDAGYQRVVTAVVPENTPAFRPLQKMGYRPFGMMGYCKIGPWRRDFYRINPHTPSSGKCSA